MKRIERVMLGLGRRALDLVERIAPREDLDWARAMRAEAEYTTSPSAYLEWGVGCLRAVAGRALRLARVRKAVVICTAGLYFALLVLLVPLAGIAFRELYTPVAAADMDRPLALYLDHVSSLNERYHGFLWLMGACLGAYMGAWCGLVCIWWSRWWLAIAGGSVGLCVTILVLSFLPWVRFPFDQYAAPVGWLFGGLPCLLGTWAMVGLFSSDWRKQVLSTSALVLVVILGPASSVAQPEDNNTRGVSVNREERTDARNLAKELNGLVPKLLKEHDVPGASIAVIDQSAVVWQGSYGFANRDTFKLVTDSTLFNIGSVSKVVAAWGVMALLQQQSEITIDSPLQPFLKRWRIPPSEFDVTLVTVRRLLSHTSGLSTFPASESFTYPHSLAEILAKSYGTFGQLRLVQQPGRTFEYNNGNYMILQLLVEDITGERFATYVQRTVLQPLGMENSTYAPVKPNQVATPYDTDGRALPLYQTYHNENFAASGGLYTTAGELAVFVAASMLGNGGELPGRGVLPSDTVSLMTSPAGETHGRHGLGYKMLPVSDTLR